jgi:nitroreductase
MDKTANTEHEILDVLKKRWSPRAFAAKPVEPAKLRSLFEAARWAASSFNEQPWIFLVATKDDKAAYEKALSCLWDKNQDWAKSAPVLILTVTKANFTRNDKPNRVHVHDLGLAMGNLTVQATSMGLYLHQMAGVDLDKVRELYNVPAGYEPATGVAIGYMGNIDDLPEEGLRTAEKSPRDRKPFSEFIFKDRFGQPSPLFV